MNPPILCVASVCAVGKGRRLCFFIFCGGERAPSALRRPKSALLWRRRERRETRGAAPDRSRVKKEVVAILGCAQGVAMVFFGRKKKSRSRALVAAPPLRRLRRVPRSLSYT